MWVLLRKTPRLSFFWRDFSGIIVWTKWQSSPMVGNSIEAGIKGNRRNGDVTEFSLGKPTRPKPQRLLGKLPPGTYQEASERSVQST